MISRNFYHWTQGFVLPSDALRLVALSMATASLTDPVTGCDILLVGSLLEIPPIRIGISDGSNPPVESSVESGSGVMAEIYKFIFQKK